MIGAKRWVPFLQLSVRMHSTVDDAILPVDLEKSLQGDDAYSSLRVDDPKKIDDLLRRYDSLLEQIDGLGQNIETIMRGTGYLSPPVSSPVDGGSHTQSQ